MNRTLSFFLLLICFIFSNSAVSQGEQCTTAIAAIQGSNSIPANSTGDYWYTYTMTDANKLEITSDTDVEVKVYTNNCDLLWYAARGYHGNLGTAELQQGEVIFINWTVNNAEGFDWMLVEKPIEAGDNCSQAIEAHEGEINTPSIINELVWYKHTMTSDGSLEINSATDLFLSLYVNGCNAESPTASGYGFNTYHDLKAGDLVNISWEIQSSGAFSWSLTELTPQIGDNCEKAEVVNFGSNTLPPGLNTYYWYSITTKSDRDLIIEANTDRIVTVFNECNLEYLPNYIAEGTNYTVITNLQPNDNILIRWPLDKENSLTWTIKENNHLPFITNQTFTIEEKTEIGAEVGVIEAFDEDGDNLTYSVDTELNELTPFTIHPLTGQLVVRNSEILDYDRNSLITISVAVNDNHGGISKAQINVELTELITTTQHKVVEKNELYIYPNPFTDMITFHFESNKKRRIAVYDVYGNKVWETINIGSKFNHSLSMLSRGVYYLTYNNDGESSITKIIKN